MEKIKLNNCYQIIKRLPAKELEVGIESKIIKLINQK
jgi:hypothetical protein